MRQIIEFWFFIICIIIIALCSKKSVDTLQEINGQELINEVISSDERYLIKVYRNTGSATANISILCTLTDNHTQMTKNIYWEQKVHDAIIDWIDNNTVSINKVILKLPEETYDWRKV